MNKKILVFGASNSSTSINQKFAMYVAQKLDGAEIHEVRITDYELPMFGVDLEKEVGRHPSATKFLDHISVCDGIILSLAEHNSNYTAAFKNLIDWSSRITGKIWQEKPMLALSTSPGKRGGAGAMNILLNTAKYMGGNIVAHFSLPAYNQAFGEDGHLADEEQRESLKAQLRIFKEQIS
ncbi:MAG: NAD(P)H-dependent oxidoreductase [Bacteroidia bacterium]|nr:NAD(P)H-dependent oxidoreductase [Bacteroidia bacterium]